MSRAHLVLIVLAAAFGSRGCVSSSSSAADRPSERSPAAVAAPSYTVTGTNRSPFGVHRDGPFPRSQETIDSIMAHVQASGADWLRVNFPWEWIETQEGARDWDRSDPVVASAERHGISLLVTIRDYTQTGLYASRPEAKLAAYRVFVGDLVRRYKDRISYWQIENEINSPSMWSASLEEYAELIRIAYRAVKAEDSTAQVLLSSFGSNFSDRMSTHPNTTAGREALESFRFVLHEAVGHYDVIDAHIYHRVTDVPRRVEFFRREAAAVAGALPIWVTETGGPDPRADDAGGPASDQVLKRYVLGVAAGVERLFWHQIAVRQGRDTNWSGMALMEGDRRRPAFYAYRAMTEKLAGYSDVERIASPDDLHIYRFAREAGDVYVVWSDAGAVSVSLPPTLSATSLRVTGVDGTVTVNSGVTLSAQSSPVYVEAGGTEGS